MSPPKILFGAGSIGHAPGSFTYTWATYEDVTSLLDFLKKENLDELDSAASYPAQFPPENPWITETLLGQAQVSTKGFIIDSKVLVKFDGPSLDEASVTKSIDKSLSLLGVPKVRTMYAHWPDTVTPVEVTAAAFDRAYKAGKFERLGICNFTVPQLQEYFEACDKNGFVKPTVYEGQYNALARGSETYLFPFLRKHKMAFNAYSPLAGGFLTGKVTFQPGHAEASNSTETASLRRTRWEGKSENPIYTAKYDRPQMHHGVRHLQSALEAYNAQHESPISLTEASLRWMMHHSGLKGEQSDGLILGAKREEQLKSNLDMCRRGPLPDALVSAAEEMWKIASDGEPVAPTTPYYIG